jgi:hypothetical protein
MSIRTSLRKGFVSALALSACLAAGMLTYAAVIVDENGVGFVGKGDVQLAFGWNNTQLQQNAGALAFYFTTTEEASWECVNVVRNVVRNRQTREQVRAVSSSIAYDGRKNRQNHITGFNLNGYLDDAETIVTGDDLHSCPQGQGWSYVPGSDETSAIDEGTVWVEHDGARKVLPLTITQ